MFYFENVVPHFGHINRTSLSLRILGDLPEFNHYEIYNDNHACFGMRLLQDLVPNITRSAVDEACEHSCVEEQGSTYSSNEAFRDDDANELGRKDAKGKGKERMKTPLFLSPPPLAESDGDGDGYGDGDVEHEWERFNSSVSMPCRHSS